MEMEYNYKFRPRENVFFVHNYTVKKMQISDIWAITEDKKLQKAYYRYVGDAKSRPDWIDEDKIFKNYVDARICLVGELRKIGINLED